MKQKAITIEGIRFEPHWFSGYTGEINGRRVLAAGPGSLRPEILKGQPAVPHNTGSGGSVGLLALTGVFDKQSDPALTQRET